MSSEAAYDIGEPDRRPMVSAPPSEGVRAELPRDGEGACFALGVAADWESSAYDTEAEDVCTLAPRPRRVRTPGEDPRRRSSIVFVRGRLLGGVLVTGDGSGSANCSSGVARDFD
jgi:hypothetical protein